MQNESILKFIQKLDELSSEYGVYIDSKYDSNISLLDENNKVIATEFHLIKGLGYDCYDI